MGDRLAELEKRVSELDRTVRELQLGLAKLTGAEAEASEPEPVDVVEMSVTDDDEDEPEMPRVEVTGEALMAWAAIAGRTFLILGGAYFLRALTETKALRATVTVPLALGYAAFWLWMCHRSAAKKPALSATAYGLAFALIAFPMLVEITTHFHFVTPAQSAAALGGVAGLSLWVAYRRKLQLFAFIAFFAPAFSAVACLLETKTGIPYMILLIGLGVASDWAAERHAWLGLQITAALLTDVAALGLLVVALVIDLHTPATTFTLLALFLGYMGTFVVRALITKRSLSLFERTQAVAALVFGYLAAIVDAWLGNHTVALWLGAASVVTGVVAYGFAYFMFVVPEKSAIDSWFNTTFPLVGVLAGSWLLLPEPAYAWTAAALLLTVLGVRDAHAALPLHGAACALLAAIVSGLLIHTGHAFAAPASGQWPTLSLTAVVTLAVAAVCYVAPMRDERTRQLPPARVGKLIELAIAVAGIGSLLVLALAEPLAGGLGEGCDVGRVAAVRTGVLAVSSLGLAALSRLRSFREAGVLVFPVLVLGGIKLLYDDFLNGRATTLFAAFVLYGVALLIAPKLRWRPPARPPRGRSAAAAH